MENVLVVKREYLAAYLVKNGLITGCESDVLEIIDEKGEFLPREAAEGNEEYKQIIPYVIIRRGDEVFVTRRLEKGGEARLHGLISLGVGGHINDTADGAGKEALLRGTRREIEEEVYITYKTPLSLSGLINDDSNSVGSVHLGFLFTLEGAEDVSVKETEKLSGEWINKSELRSLAPQMETWSQIALDAIL